MQVTEKLVDSIDTHLQQLNGDITALEAARAALLSNGSAPTPVPHKAVKRRGRSPRAKATAIPKPKPKRATEALQADRAERLLAQTDGITTAELAKRAGAGRDQVLALLRDLEKATRVRRTGQRRSTRWHAITDEDRLQQRAAELETRRRRRPTRPSVAPDS